MEWEEDDVIVGHHLEEEEPTILMIDVMNVVKEVIMPETAIDIGVLVEGNMLFCFYLD